jgi:hypothetical protein
LAAGRLTLVPEGILLDGTRQRGGRLATWLIARKDLKAVRIGRAPHERIRGRPALIVELADGSSVALSALGPGVLGELADLLAALPSQQAEKAGHVLVIVPLRKGSLARARTLIEHGPPFDPETVGLEHHDVFLTEREAVFIFDVPDMQCAVARLADSALWSAAADWRSCIAGKPRIAEQTYTWTRD